MGFPAVPCPFESSGKRKLPRPAENPAARPHSGQRQFRLSETSRILQTNQQRKHIIQSLPEKGAHSAMMTMNLCSNEHFLPLERKPVFLDSPRGNPLCLKQSGVLHAVNLLQGIPDSIRQGLLAVLGIQNLKLNNNCIHSAII